MAQTSRSSRIRPDTIRRLPAKQQTDGARARYGFAAGRHVFEFAFNEKPFGSHCGIGLCTADAQHSITGTGVKVKGLSYMGCHILVKSYSITNHEDLEIKEIPHRLPEESKDEPSIVSRLRYEGEIDDVFLSRLLHCCFDQVM